MEFISDLEYVVSEF